MRDMSVSCCGSCAPSGMVMELKRANILRNGHTNFMVSGVGLRNLPVHTESMGHIRPSSRQGGWWARNPEVTLYIICSGPENNPIL